MNRTIYILGSIIGISFFLIVVSPSENGSLRGQSIEAIEVLRGGKRSKYPDNFDKNFHRILRKGFPDFESRVEYEKKQRELYNSARKKLNMLPPAITMSTIKKEETLSSQERDAIAYIEGTGFYSKQQDLRTKPNIFDTRETFLLKMHDKNNRTNVLNALKRRNKLTDEN